MKRKSNVGFFDMLAAKRHKIERDNAVESFYRKLHSNSSNADGKDRHMGARGTNDEQQTHNGASASPPEKLLHPNLKLKVFNLSVHGDTASTGSFPDSNPMQDVPTSGSGSTPEAHIELLQANPELKVSNSSVAGRIEPRLKRRCIFPRK